MAYVVDRRKITDYLLADNTPQAAAKSCFFAGIGFASFQWRLLEEALLAHPRTARLQSVLPDVGYGAQEVYLCLMLAAPNGRSSCVRTVWQQRGSDFHFVTAYPQPMDLPNAR